ncbi:MAG: ornithine carbamoyltransferase [Bradymonadia bacterium]
MSKRDLLTLAALTEEELLGLIERAQALKAMRKAGGHTYSLRGRALAMVFEKASTRTRVSFEVGMNQLGGHAVVMARRDIQIGRGETIADTAKVLSRYVDGIMMRTHAHEVLTELATHADVPVINGLTDLAHPCQVLADLLTCSEVFGDLRPLKVAYVGDGNNMAHSWINAARVLGFELNLACPEGYDPDRAVLHEALKDDAKIKVVRDPVEATEGVHVVNTDVFTSMGQEEETETRNSAFQGYQVNDAVMAVARPEAIFLHCLPAHRGEEVTASVIDGPQSRVFDQAENRLHAQKAVLDWLMGGHAIA